MATLWDEYKLIQTSKGKRKLVDYFKNWKVTLKVLNKPQKKDNKSSSNANKQVKNPMSQKSKSNKKKKAKGGGNTNKEVLAEILVLLQNLI
ncbi:hypothetical protein GLOIN_2v1641446 [Rhizophagus irregularis DAOM 181602=DAOM 197198]|nr:hypothetical protein GLOIN_2v1641446 [Rhizophagus irregularis DAOM 181602=DAOM 197198]